MITRSASLTLLPAPNTTTVTPCAFSESIAFFNLSLLKKEVASVKIRKIFLRSDFAVGKISLEARDAARSILAPVRLNVKSFTSFSMYATT